MPGIDDFFADAPAPKVAPQPAADGTPAVHPMDDFFSDAVDASGKPLPGKNMAPPPHPDQGWAGAINQAMRNFNANITGGADIANVGKWAAGDKSYGETAKATEDARQEANKQYPPKLSAIGHIIPGLYPQEEVNAGLRALPGVAGQALDAVGYGKILKGLQGAKTAITEGADGLVHSTPVQDEMAGVEKLWGKAKEFVAGSALGATSGWFSDPTASIDQRNANAGVGAVVAPAVQLGMRGVTNVGSYLLDKGAEALRLDSSARDRLMAQLYGDPANPKAPTIIPKDLQLPKDANPLPGFRPTVAQVQHPDPATQEQAAHAVQSLESGTTGNIALRQREQEQVGQTQAALTQSVGNTKASAAGLPIAQSGVEAQKAPKKAQERLAETVDLAGKPKELVADASGMLGADPSLVSLEQTERNSAIRSAKAKVAYADAYNQPLIKSTYRSPFWQEIAPRLQPFLQSAYRSMQFDTSVTPKALAKATAGMQPDARMINGSLSPRSLILPAGNFYRKPEKT
jgi:hypothetical protein